MTTSARDGGRPLVAVTRALPGELAVEGADLRVGGERAMSRDELREFVRGAAGVIAWVSERIDAEVLDAAGPGLRVVSNYAVGTDNVDLGACRERGVVVTNTPNVVTEGTANIAIGLLLAVARRIVEGDRFARSGEWARHGVLGPNEFLGVHLTGQTMLIVGAGRIGLAVARRAAAFGMRIEYVARSKHWEFELAPLAARRVELDDGLRRADVVSLHTPLTDQTRGLVCRARIEQMKPTAILINTARGPVVDEGALAAALRERRIFGAGLDVFEREPRVHEGLAALDNVVMTPHLGSGERMFREMMTRMACENVEAVLAGREPRHRVV
ncbi:MAG: D-glycerate dehydrogenase [Phycisphaeraceae bacterium]|nr:D-glycerate dehydrogenase [Phycisphaeraceae bacterium]